MLTTDGMPIANYMTSTTGCKLYMPTNDCVTTTDGMPSTACQPILAYHACELLRVCHFIILVMFMKSTHKKPCDIFNYAVV